MRKLFLKKETLLTVSQREMVVGGVKTQDCLDTAWCPRSDIPSCECLTMADENTCETQGQNCGQFTYTPGCWTVGPNVCMA